MQSHHAYKSHDAKYGETLYNVNIPLVCQPLLLPMENKIMS